MTFANGCTVSVQFGYHNYCSSNQTFPKHEPETGVASPDAEVGAWDSEGAWIQPEGFELGSDNVIGHLSPDEVAAFIQAVKDYPNGQN